MHKLTRSADLFTCFCFISKFNKQAVREYNFNKWAARLKAIAEMVGERQVVSPAK